MNTISAINDIEITEQEKKFITEIKKLPDTRDNRGKKHTLSFLIISVVFALLSDRSKVSINLIVRGEVLYPLKNWGSTNSLRFKNGSILN